jgi:hypothetical protein
MSLTIYGTWAYKAGASGTPPIPGGARVLTIVAHASGSGASVTINGGDAIPIVAGAAPTKITFKHQLLIAQANGLVFTGTDQYYVEFLKPAGS